MFYRSQRHPFGRSVSRPLVRLLLAAMYALYVAGCLFCLMPDGGGFGVAASISGFAMIVASILILVWLGGSSLQRQVHEEEFRLDEREVFERNRATQRAFTLFSGIVLVAVFYVMIATDIAEADKFDLWRPTTGEHWNAVLGAAVILAVTLPAAFLAFAPDGPDAGD